MRETGTTGRQRDRQPFTGRPRMNTFVSLGCAVVLVVLGFVANAPSAGAADCIHGAPGCAWQPGDETTHPDTAWKVDLQSDLLVPDYDTVYASTNGVFRIGAPASGPGFFDAFGSATPLIGYLGQSGTPAALTSSWSNPPAGTDHSGTFGSRIAALKLNVDFSDAGHGRASATPFGDLSVCQSATAFDGMTVRQILDTANLVLSGQPQAGVTPSLLTSIATSLNAAFPVNGVGPFAYDHLVDGPCPQSPSISVGPPSRAPTVGKAVTLTASLSEDTTGLPYPDVRIRFTVSGANTDTNEFGTTDANGTAMLTYTGTNPGQDTVSMFADFNDDGVQDGVDPTATTTVTWTDTPGDLQLHGPGSTLFAGPTSFISAVVAKGGTATFSGKVVNTGTAAVAYTLKSSVDFSDCDPTGCPDPVIKIAGTGVTFNATDQDYVTKPVAVGAPLSVTVTAKLPATGPAGNNYFQILDLMTAGHVTLDTHPIAEAVTSSTGTHANDLFVTPTGSGKAGAGQGSTGFASAKVLGPNQTTTVTVQLHNDTASSATVTAHMFDDSCTDPFTVVAKVGTSDVTTALRGSGYVKTLAARASVSITLTLRAVGTFAASCNPASALWAITADSGSENTQAIGLVANTQAT